ncbi:StaA [Pseudomonas savastanoi]|uniref:StaA n=1 Tax=Pseudomonas savastanoi TaxID=29438 RepID=UPI000E328C68|nr:StaA [Pseudomonas savastanoi]
MPLSGIRPNSDSAVVRNKLAEIEAALEAGASRERVYEVLKEEHGLSFNFNAFCQALKRARAKKRPARPGQETATGIGKEVDCAIQKTDCAIQNQDVDCAMQPESSGTAPIPAKVKPGRIVTRKDFAEVHDIDFSNLDDKYK